MHWRFAGFGQPISGRCVNLFQRPRPNYIEAIGHSLWRGEWA